MKISDLFIMCVHNLTRRKFRTLLTVIGVVIGTCAIVVMISLGEGINASSEAFLNEAGDLSIIQVYGPYGSSQEMVLDDSTLREIRALEGVGAATPMARLQNAYGNVCAGRKDRYQYGSYNLIGVIPDALPELGYLLNEEQPGEAPADMGALLSENLGGKRIPVLLGYQAVYEFEDTKKSWPNNMIWAEMDENGNLPEPFFDPLTQRMSLVFSSDSDSEKELRYELVVVGTFADQGFYDESAYSMFLNVEDLNRIQKEYKKFSGVKSNDSAPSGYDYVKVKVSDVKLVGQVEAAIGSDGYGFSTYSLASIRESYEKNARQIQLILGALGFISLFVAAISITNTMIMSVYERTREIGVMKVLGCKVGNIRSIFLVEAGLIGFGGGIIGVGLSVLLSLCLNTFSGTLGNVLGNLGMMGGGESSQVSIIPPWLMLLGLLFATFIGLVSGFYPANRAVRISALEAIRQE